MTTEDYTGMQESFGSTIHLQTEDVDMDQVGWVLYGLLGDEWSL